LLGKVKPRQNRPNPLLLKPINPKPPMSSQAQSSHFLKRRQHDLTLRFQTLPVRQIRQRMASLGDLEG
jgi:hypothetical protein